MAVDNNKNITLLQNDPHALILKFQPTIRIIVLKFVAQAFFPSGELEDVIQSVNEGLLMRMSSIQRHYDGSSNVVTYLSAVVRNLCLTLGKEMKSPLQLLGVCDPPGESADSVLDEVTLAQAADALEEVIDLVPAQRSRLLILLPLHFKLPLSEYLIRTAFPDCNSSEVLSLSRDLGGNNSLKRECDIYELVTPFLNKIEGRTITPDGYRRWMSEKIPQVIELLNLKLGGANFTKETFQLLVERSSLQNGPRK